MFRFPSVNELRAKFAGARYLVDEHMIQQVYLAGVNQKPILTEGPGVAERAITLDDLQRLRGWVVTEPWRPTVIGTRTSVHSRSAATVPCPKTVLLRGQSARGNAV